MVIKMKKWWRSEYLSIPNLMGYFRILLIPLYLSLYFKAGTREEYIAAALVIGISGVTDWLDGFVARKYHMITKFGKILDPAADKLTQAAIVLSLVFRYPLMSYVFVFFLAKEIYMAAMGAYMLKRGRQPDGTLWCGKVCTTVLYVVMFLLILLPDIRVETANLLMLVCIGFMLYSLISYFKFYGRAWKELKQAAEGRPKKEKSGRKMWIAIALTAAVLLYLIAGAVLPYRRQPQVSEEFAESVDWETFYSDMPSGDRAKVIKENKEALEQRIRLIANAKESIILSTFAFQSDESGKDMLAVLLQAADREVDIKILADGFNSRLYMDLNPYFYALSANENVEIKIYNPVSLLTPWTSMGRMHDKYVIADDELYILGGRNTFDYFLGDYEGYKNYDWDVLVYNTGQKEGSVRQVKEYFRSVWKLPVCRLFKERPGFSRQLYVEKAAQELKERCDAMQKAQPDLFRDYNYEEETVPVNKITLLSNPTGIYPKEPEAFYVMTGLMKNAKKEVYIHTPYVILNEDMYKAFEAISQRVENFRLLTNSAFNNGNLFAAGDYLINKSRILETGVQVSEYEGGISYHGKCAVIDDDMSLVGSFNMDMRSAYLDTELMLAIDSRELNAQLKEQMEAYEDKALTVLDEERYEEKEGMVKQKLPFSRYAKIKLMRFAAGWARFLL